MGDIIEITAAAYQPFFYYKVSGNGLWIDIKTRNSALVGLAKECGKSQYWFDFSDPGAISISEASETRTNRSALPFVLSADNYTRFWIAWDNKQVRAGIGDSSNVAISYPISVQLNYVTFGTCDTTHVSHFRFEVPPLCLRIPKLPSEPKLSKGKLEWKHCHDQLPDEVVIGGHIDGEIVYVVRAHHRYSLTPGVFIPSRGLAYIPWGESDNPTGNFEALCGVNLKWKAATALTIPKNAFVAGYSEVNREPLYIGRVCYEGNKIPGKVQLSHNTCYIAHKGREIAVKNFDVLIEPELNAHCANKYIKCNRNNVDFDQNDHSWDDEENEVPVWE